MKTAGKRTPPTAADAARPVAEQSAAWAAWLQATLSDIGWFALACVLTVVAFSLVFPPINIWILGFVCLAPWGFAVCRCERTWIVYWGSFVAGWLFFLVNLMWLMPVTGLGFGALAFYLAIYWPLAAWAVRTARRIHIGPTWSLPVVWVACEYLRGTVMSGFPWMFLAHAFYKHVAFIQISDTTGAYGVTFIVAMVNGLLIEIALRWRRESGRRRRVGPVVAAAVVTTLVLVGNLFYGWRRLSEAEFVDGPRIAVVQEDFPLVSTPPYGEPLEAMIARNLALAAKAAAEHPDLLAFPETVWQGYQNIDFVETPGQAVDDVPAGASAFGQRVHHATAAFARGDYVTVNRIIDYYERRLSSKYRATLPGGKLPRLPEEGGPPVTVLLGSVSIDVLPEQTSPRYKKFNSALVYDADGNQRRLRYDKIHLVPFGEIVPFRNQKFLGISFHWLYVWLNYLSPFSQGGTVDYSLWPGDRFTVFDLSVGDKATHFGVPICYEDTVPYMARKFSWDGAKRRADFLVNISNDGWFLHSNELELHLAICTFRAVENRIGIARAVNTGISGFIDPAGRAYSLMEVGGKLVGPGIIGYRIAPVKIDTRSSFYGHYGDVFAVVCTLLTAGLWLGGVATRWVYALYLWIVARRRKGVRT